MKNGQLNIREEDADIHKGANDTSSIDKMKMNARQPGIAGTVKSTNYETETVKTVHPKAQKNRKNGYPKNLNG